MCPVLSGTVVCVQDHYLSSYLQYFKKDYLVPGIKQPQIRIENPKSALLSVVVHFDCVDNQDAVFLARSLEFNDTLATLNFTHNPIGEVSKGVRDEILLCVPCCQRTQTAATATNRPGNIRDR